MAYKPCSIRYQPAGSLTWQRLIKIVRSLLVILTYTAKRRVTPALTSSNASDEFSGLQVSRYFTILLCGLLLVSCSNQQIHKDDQQVVITSVDDQTSSTQDSNGKDSQSDISNLDATLDANLDFNVSGEFEPPELTRGSINHTEQKQVPPTSDASIGQQIAPILKPFRVQYRTRVKLGWIKLDVNATRTLEQLNHDEWEIRFDATASVGQINEYSRFRLMDDEIEPIIYRRRASGLIDKYNQTLEFNNDLQQIIDLETELPLPIQWQAGIQNDLTYMLQIMLDLKNNKEKFSYPVYQKNRIKVLNFGVTGREIIKTQAGIFETLKVSQIRNDNKRVDAWFTDDDFYHFIRLLDQKDGEVRYRIDAVDIQG